MTSPWKPADLYMNAVFVQVSRFPGVSCIVKDSIVAVEGKEI